MRHLFSLLMALIAFTAACAPARAVTLVKEGQPVANIVISKAAFEAKPYAPGVNAAGTPEEKARLAANELQKYVELMSGAKLPILSDDALPADDKGTHVFVGAGAHTAAMKVKIPSGLTASRVEEGYLIHAQGNTLVLAGNDAGPYNGTIFAVSEFLNRQGVRWFMPSDFGQVVPKKATIEIDKIELVDKPSFLVRSWNGNLAPDLRADDALWRLHNKGTLDFNNILGIPGDGWLQQYMPDPALVKTNPEYFARKMDGSIDPAMVSLSNPKVPALVAEKIKARIKAERVKNPNFNSLGFAPYDGLPIDLAPETMKNSLGLPDLVGREGVPNELSISEEWFNFVNKVTEEVVKEYPDFIITTNGYTNRTTPPEGLKLHPNMGVMFAAIWADLLHSYDDPKSWQQQVQGQMLKRWGEVCPRVFVYNYNFPMLVNALSPLPMTRKIARNTPLMKKWGIVGFEDEQTFSWMAHGINTFYLRAKLYWNANADSQAVLADYYNHWYGPAAKPAQAFWDAIEEAFEKTPLLGHEDRVLPYVYTDAMIATMEARQAEAEKVATEEPYKTRVRVDRLTLEHLKGYMAMNRAEFVGDYPEAIKQADKMFAARMELNKISAFLHFPESKDPHLVYFSGCYYWNLTQRKEHYQKVQEMISGKTGTLIAKAPREVKFSLDEADLGRYARWQDAGFDHSKWRMIDTATPFYLQTLPGEKPMLEPNGVPYVGTIWYVFELDVPKSAVGKPARVYSPIVATEAWVWTNGEFSGHRPYQEAYIRPAEMNFDVTSQLKPGKNVIAVRVSTSSSRVQVAEGFQGPLFLYSPKPEAPTEKK